MDVTRYLDMSSDIIGEIGYSDISLSNVYVTRYLYVSYLMVEGACVCLDELVYLFYL